MKAGISGGFDNVKRPMNPAFAGLDIIFYFCVNSILSSSLRSGVGMHAGDVPPPFSENRKPPDCPPPINVGGGQSGNNALIGGGFML
ncbi:MAG: hypothetical protein ACR2P5_05945 [Gammaproteobacteria bacterium]